MKLNKLLLALAASGIATSAFATNGMNLEGYGPIAAGMGGASMAYDNGTSAVMNNPATLGLMNQGSRLDVAVGMLGPDVKVVGGQTSGGDAYFMPAGGYIKKDGTITYGVAMFAQGGMGTEFARSMVQDGSDERSELGVGRLIAPLAINVNDKLTVAGSADFVWAMLDVKMAMMGSQFSQLVTVPPAGAIGGIMANLAANEKARIDFSDSNDYTGKAKGYGFAGKLGFTYKASPTVTIGGVYQSKTNLSDLETSDTGAVLSADLNNDGQYAATDGEVAPGKITVKNFQWPETYGLGVSVQATPSLMIAADVKRVGWKNVMENFTMTYETMGDSVTFALPQNWKNQTVVSLGASYQVNDKLIVRAGANLADNPIPDATLHYLFPAIVEKHYTLGVGYALDKDVDLNFSLQHAPKSSATGTTVGSNAGVTVEHSQTSWQLMYSKRF